MLIREAREADLPRLLELFFQLSELGEQPEPTVRELTDGLRSAFQELKANRLSTCWVLEVEGRVEGALSLHLLPTLAHGGRPFAIIEDVVVEQKHRGSGYGRQLMTQAEKVAQAHGCYKISLTSNRRRLEAHAFYERLGYTATHRGFTKYLTAGL